VSADGTNVWEADFSKMQWPGFWKSLFEDTGLLDVLDCREVEDAAVLYEDMVLHRIARGDDPHEIDSTSTRSCSARAPPPHDIVHHKRAEISVRRPDGRVEIGEKVSGPLRSACRKTGARRDCMNRRAPKSKLTLSIARDVPGIG